VHSFKVTRRNLPHWQKPGSIYFITWRLKSNHILSEEERQITLQDVHVLAQPLPKPGGGVFDLAEIIHSVKRHSARGINQLRGTQGPLWQDERFDRIVRDETEFLEKWQYIRNNPVKAGLAGQPEDYPWLHEKCT